MNRIPDQTSYNEYKYLWYVGLSRAMNELTIYVDESKPIWTGLKDVPNELYTIDGNIRYENVNNDKKEQISYHYVTKILERIKSQDLYNLEEMIGATYTTNTIGDSIIDISTLPEYSKYSSLYGCVIEGVFNYLWRKRVEGRLEGWVEKYKKYIEEYTILPKRYYQAYIEFVNLYGNDFDYYTLQENFKTMSNKCKGIFRYIESLYENKKEKLEHIIPISVDSDIIENNTSSLIEAINKLSLVGCDFVRNIFYIELFKYQKQYEAKYELDRFNNGKFNDIINCISNQLSHIIKFSDKLTKDAKLQQELKHPNINIGGVADIIIDDSIIIDIKFKKEISIKDILQLLLYYNNLSPSWDKPKKLFIWNIMDGKEYSIKFEKSFSNYELLKKLCNILSTKLTGCTFIYDLETTGIDTKSSDIIERYFVEKNLNFSPSNGLIYHNKDIPSEITQLTGITTDMCKENGDIGYDKLKDDIDTILRVCEKPVFIAHNGNTFDHLVMKNLNIFPSTIDKDRLKDSRIMIRLLKEDPSKSYKLGELYIELFGKPYDSAHRAKADVDMLVKILKRLDI
jgi:hypothetical protein